MALKPAAIVRADYGIAQTPSLGGEIEVYASTQPAGLVKKVRNMGGSEYETKVYNSEGYGGTKTVIVGPFGLHGALAGVISVPDWALNKSTNFPTGWAGEGAVPAAFGQRGDVLEEYEFPDFNPSDANPNYWPIGCTTEKKLKLPTRMSKAIACQLVSAEWVTPGKTEIGELSVSAYNLGHAEGLLKIAGLKTTVMLRVMREGVLEVARIFIADWTPAIDRTDPEGDGESTVSASGLFSRCAIFTAEGTAAGG